MSPVPCPPNELGAGTLRRLLPPWELVERSWMRAQPPPCTSERGTALFFWVLRSRNRSSRASPVGCVGGAGDRWDSWCHAG